MKHLDGDEALEVEPTSIARVHCDHARQPVRSLSRSCAASIDQLSRRAVELAYGSALDDVDELAARLYCYNRIPLSARSQRRFPTEASLLNFLGLDAVGALRNSRRQGNGRAVREFRQAPEELSRFWRYWKIPHAAPPKAGGYFYKVYVSPLIDDLPQVLHGVLKILPRCGACSAKLGRDLPDLLRPDKLLLYFGRLDEALAAGQELRSQLVVNEAHGVPFTFQIGATSLVSLGVDPPASAQRAGPDRRRSWRVTVTRRLARIILDVRKQRCRDPIDSIYAELRRSGIDPNQWKPFSDAWDLTMQSI